MPRPVDPAVPGPVLIDDASGWTSDELAAWFAGGPAPDRPQRWYQFDPPCMGDRMSLFIDLEGEARDAKREADADAAPSRAECLADRVGAVADELRHHAAEIAGAPSPRSAIVALAAELDTLAEELANAEG